MVGTEEKNDLSCQSITTNQELMKKGGLDEEEAAFRDKENEAKLDETPKENKKKRCMNLKEMKKTRCH